MKTPKQPRPDHLKWEGGYMRPTKKGAVTYVIDRWVGGTHFHVSTRCTLRRAAIKQLERFEADPFHYLSDRKAGKVEPRADLRITEDLVAEYRDWMIDRKGNTREWSMNVASHLADWMEDLGGKDLRDLSVTADLKPALVKRKTSQRHRIESIKSFCGWLRREKGLLRHAEDPTLELSAPPIRAAKLNRRRVVEGDRIKAVMPHLPAETADVLLFLNSCGWHVSEVRRFAERGEIVALNGDPKHLAIVRTPHKSGKWHPTFIDFPEHLAAARRIRARGYLPSTTVLCGHMRRACDLAGIVPFSLGVMRHTVLTYAVEHGASVEQVSAFAGHAAGSTTAEKFYVDINRPTVSVNVLRLVEPLEDGEPEKTG